MRFESSVQRLLIFMLMGFAAVMAAATYWAVVGAETLLDSPFNARQNDAISRIIRGEIFDRNGALLVSNMIDQNGFVSREIHDQSLYSLIGFMSRRYGLSGIEASYHSLLNSDGQPDDLGAALRRDVLHIAPRGRDIQLTIDLQTQRIAADMLDALGLNSAVIVMDAQTGSLLASVSRPRVDTATLDEHWDTLAVDENAPLLDRATRGQYALGSALSPIILTAWLIDGRGMDDALTVEPSDANDPCHPADGALTVRAAFSHSCEAGLSEMISRLGTEKLEATASLFGLYEHAQLDGLAVLTPALPEDETPRDADSALTSAHHSPLYMAMMASAIASGGNTPPPTLLAAIRPPDAANWQPVPSTGRSAAVTTAQTAARVAAAMRESAASGLARGGECAIAEIGAIVGRSSSDALEMTFYVGFTQSTDGHVFVTALVTEGPTQLAPSRIAEAGSTILCAAAGVYTVG